MNDSFKDNIIGISCFSFPFIVCFLMDLWLQPMKTMEPNVEVYFGFLLFGVLLEMGVIASCFFIRNIIRGDKEPWKI